MRSKPAHLAASSKLIWLLYLITSVDDDRLYVGITSRTEEARFNAHISEAQRRGGERRHPGTLAHAIRQAIAGGRDPHTVFRILAIARFPTAEAARQAEKRWINNLQTAAPRGYNVMPGGASVGGIANATTVKLKHPTRGRVTYPTISAAIAARNEELAAKGVPPLAAGVIYARLAMRWPPEEAFGYRRHVDGRSARADVELGGRKLPSLRDATPATRRSVDALRSRLHRARRAVRRPCVLPHPFDPAAAPVNSTEFEALTSVPKATILDRLARLRAAGDPSEMPRQTVLDFLMRPTDRRTVIALPLPDGRVLTGGIRSVIKTVLAEPAVTSLREENLSGSAIRARLRKTLKEPQPDLPWAFGFVRKRNGLGDPLGEG